VVAPAAEVPGGLLKQLVSEGWLYVVDGIDGNTYHRISDKAREVCSSKAIKRISRARVEALIRDVQEMAAHQNREGHWLNSIKQISLFGSSLDPDKIDYGNVNLVVDFEQRCNQDEVWSKTLAGHRDGFWARPEGHTFYWVAQRKQTQQLGCGRLHIVFGYPSKGMSSRVIYSASADEIANGQILHDTYYADRDKRRQLLASKLFGALIGDDNNIDYMCVVAEEYDKSNNVVAVADPGKFKPAAIAALDSYADYELRHSKSFNNTRHDWEVLSLLGGTKAEQLKSRIIGTPPNTPLELNMVELNVYCQALDGFCSPGGDGYGDKELQIYAKKPYRSELGTKQIKQVRDCGRRMSAYLGPVLSNHKKVAQKALRTILGI
jgi:hypothetical protein